MTMKTKIEFKLDIGSNDSTISEKDIYAAVLDAESYINIKYPRLRAHIFETKDKHVSKRNVVGRGILLA